MLLDSLGYQHNDRTTLKRNKHNIPMYRIPLNTTAWLRPCDVLVFGSAKNKVRKAIKHALDTDERPGIWMSCDELHKAVHEMISEDII